MSEYAYISPKIPRFDWTKSTFKDTLVYGLVLRLQRVEMRSNMCIPFVHDILDQKNGLFGSLVRDN